MSVFTVEPANLTAGAQTVHKAASETSPIGDGIAPANPRDYGQIISGTIGVAEPFTTTALTDTIDQLAEFVSSIGTRLQDSASRYRATEAANVDAVRGILAAIDATFN